MQSSPVLLINLFENGEFMDINRKGEQAMGVETISASLRIWSQTGDQPPAASFFHNLVIQPGDPIKKGEGPGVPRVELVSLALPDFSEAEEPEEAFVEALNAALLRGAEWLARQSPEVFESWRAAGFITDLFIGAWIEEDQLDLDLPPEFLTACGRLGLTISICTND